METAPVWWVQKMPNWNGVFKWFLMGNNKLFLKNPWTEDRNIYINTNVQLYINIYSIYIYIYIFVHHVSPSNQVHQEAFLGKLKGIKGISMVETQTYTLEEAGETVWTETDWIHGYIWIPTMDPSLESESWKVEVRCMICWLKCHLGIFIMSNMSKTLCLNSRGSWGYNPIPSCYQR